jgi:hypothetical protein
MRYAQVSHALSLNDVCDGFAMNERALGAIQGTHCPNSHIEVFFKAFTNPAIGRLSVVHRVSRPGSLNAVMSMLLERGATLMG